VAAKLSDLGLQLTEKNVFTCAMATARFIVSQKPGAKVFVIGEGGLITALHINGCVIDEKAPDFVVVGEGRVLNFELVERAVRFLMAGAKLVATNLDPNCPTDQGLRPGCGAIVALLEAATGLRAFSVGKPSPVIMRMALEELGAGSNPGDVTMIGDTMETDILGGLQMGLRTVLVLTGSNDAQSLSRYAFSPSRVISSVAVLAEEIEALTPFPLPRRLGKAREGAA
jgi:NagD protein